jgi:hypothetical protein
MNKRKRSDAPEKLSIMALYASLNADDQKILEHKVWKDVTRHKWVGVHDNYGRSPPHIVDAVNEAGAIIKLFHGHFFDRYLEELHHWSRNKEVEEEDNDKSPYFAFEKRCRKHVEKYDTCPYIMCRKPKGELESAHRVVNQIIADVPDDTIVAVVRLFMRDHQRVFCLKDADYSE